MNSASITAVAHATAGAYLGECVGCIVKIREAFANPAKLKVKEVLALLDRADICITEAIRLSSDVARIAAQHRMAGDFKPATPPARRVLYRRGGQ